MATNNIDLGGGRGGARPLRVAVAVALAGCLATGGVFFPVRDAALASFRQNFEAAAAIRAQLLRAKLDEALLVARGVKQFHAAGGDFTRERFSTFCAPFVNGSHGLLAVSWVLSVPQSGRPGLEQRGRWEIGPDFTLTECDEKGRRVRAAEKPGYYPVFFVEPTKSETRPVLGFDLGCTPERREAIDRACDTGQPASSARTTLADRPSGHGILVFAPVYRRGAATDTVEERRAALEAFAVSVLRPDVLFADALAGSVPLGLPCDLLDLSAPPELRLLGHWTARLAGTGRGWARWVPPQPPSLQRFSFAGRDWGLEVRAGTGYLERNYPFTHWVLLPVGLSSSLWLGFYLYGALSRREEALAAARMLEAEVEERRRVEEALRASEERYRMVADNASDWVFWVLPDGSFRYLSPSCEAITGYPAGAFEGDPGLFDSIVHPEDGPLFADHRRVARMGRGGPPLEFRILRADGQERWIEHHCKPVFDDAGQFVGTRGSNRDVTNRKLLEAQLRQARKLESLGALAGGAAHQLNNILMGILGNAEMALKKLPEDSPVRPKAEAVIDASLRAAELVRRLLVFGGKEAPVHDQVPLGDVVRELAPSLKAAAPQGCAVAVDVPDGLPPVLGDWRQLRQVVLNLAENACEAVGEGSGQVAVSVGRLEVTATGEPVLCADRNLSAGEYVFIEVADSGCGISPEDQEKIFDPFFTTKFAGRGLGLAVVRGVVRNHDGGIQVESEPGRGTTVRVFFPVSPRGS